MELFHILEYSGIVAFTISAIISGIEYELDLFGIFVIAMSTSLGGGILRDIILGKTPPAAFEDSSYFLVTLATTVFILLAYRLIRKTRFFGRVISSYRSFFPILVIFDALGLGIFTISGTNRAIIAGFGDNYFLSIFVGVLTGVGGGLLRDILIGREPVLLRKEIYAVAAMAGSAAFCLLAPVSSNIYTIYGCAFLITAIRLVSFYFNLHLPRINLHQ